MKRQKLTVRPPTLINGVWCVLVTDGSSPLSKILEKIECGNQESAWQAYRRIKADTVR
jgi:hypothetical protein